MDANATLLAGYKEIADEVTEFRARAGIARQYQHSDVMERVIAIMNTDPARFEQLGLTPAQKIEIGLYINAKKAWEAAQGGGGGNG